MVFCAVDNDDDIFAFVVLDPSSLGWPVAFTPSDKV